MSMKDCIEQAVRAGRIDQARARLATERFDEFVRRGEFAGLSRAEAEFQAASDLIDGMAANAAKARHTILRQAADMRRANARYAGAARRDPDLLLKDIEVAEFEANGLVQQFMAGIGEFLARHRTNVLSRVRDPAKIGNIVRELHGEATGDAVAKSMAQAVREQMERARLLFNHYGGDIGKLADWGLPHSHNARAITRAGFDAWQRQVIDRLDWHRMIDRETGKPFAAGPGQAPRDPAQAEAFLRDVFENITTGGWNTRTPSLSVGGRALYSRRNDHRVLHFRGAEDWLSYNESFGTANPFDAIVGHLRAMARDIALMKNFGPNPAAGITYRGQLMMKEARTGDLPPSRAKVIHRKNTKAQAMLASITGASNVPVHEGAAAFLAGTRSLLTAAQLGSAIISQLTDIATTRLAARAVGMNPNGPLQQTITLLTSRVSQDEARAMGYVLDTWFNTNSASNRLLGEIWQPQLTQAISTFVLRASGLSHMTDLQRTALRQVFSLELAEQAGRSWDELPGDLRTFMENRSITSEDWDRLRLAEHLDTIPTGARALTPAYLVAGSSLPRAEAEALAMKLGGLIEAHVERGVPVASTRGRVTMMSDTRPGTFIGEVARSSTMYKSYALSLMFNWIRLIGERRNLWDAAFTAGLFTAQMTALGALAVQLKEIARGRDPRPMDTPQYWAAAFLQGGGFGIFGDFFSSSTSRAGGRLAETTLGPVAGAIGDVSRAVGSNVARSAEGKDLLIGRDVANLGRRYNPLATFWPTRVAADRIVWDQLQQLLDPEAEEHWHQATRRMQRDFGTDMWWQRGARAPSRAPDLSNALGGR